MNSGAMIIGHKKTPNSKKTLWPFSELGLFRQLWTVKESVALRSVGVEGALLLVYESALEAPGFTGFFGEACWC
jgi:hypothetical protein